MPRVIAIMNQKGGVGKTTTTLNLGAALALKGRRVLLVDLDPQANLTLGLGKRASDLSESVYELLTNPKVDTAKLVVQTAWERLHIIPSHIDLSGAEIEMVTMIGREQRLSKALDPVRNNYDYILIDCLPSLSLLTVNAMATATEVFVPLQSHPFALEGLGKLFEVVGMIREAMNPQLRVTGVLVTMFDGRTNVSKVTLDALRRDDRLRDQIFTTTIKQNIKVAESQKDGMPVLYFDPGCHAAKAYQALCEEVLEMEHGTRASDCAAKIMARNRNHPFTADLLAPAPRTAAEEKRAGSSAAPSVVPATPTEHVAPVSALVSGTTAPAEELPAPAPAAPPPPEPPVLRNAPETESIHPANGAFANSSLDVTPEVLANAATDAAVAQALQAGVVPETNGGAYDANFRPRLNVKPGACKVPLPENL